MSCWGGRVSRQSHSLGTNGGRGGGWVPRQSLSLGTNGREGGWVTRQSLSLGTQEFLLGSLWASCDLNVTYNQVGMTVNPPPPPLGGGDSETVS